MKKLPIGLLSLLLITGTAFGQIRLKSPADNTSAPIDIKQDGGTLTAKQFNRILQLLKGITTNNVGWLGLGLNGGNVGKMLHVNGDSYFNGKIGIGTTSPSVKLHVNGSSYFSGKVGIGTNNPVGKLDVTNGSYKTFFTGNALVFKNNSVQSYIDKKDYGALVFRTGSGPTPRLSINGSNGNVRVFGKLGIGIANPTDKLEVSGSLRIHGGSIKFMKPNTTSGWARGMSYNGASSKVAIGVYGVGNQIQNMYLAYGDSPWSNGKGMYIKENGNVGIGTTSPSVKLHVKGHLQLDSSGSIGGTNFNAGAIRIGAVSNGLAIDGNEIRRFTNNDRLYIDAGTRPLVLQSNQSTGNVGIGTKNPTAKLHVTGKTRIMNIQLGWTNEINNLNGHLYLQHRGGHNTLFNKGGGNVGIGTTEPGAKLHVAGNVIAATPTDSNHLTTKAYVDEKVANAGGYWSKSGTNLSYTDGKVGIGTTSPGSGNSPNTSAKLDVRGGAIIDGMLSLDHYYYSHAYMKYDSSVPNAKFLKYGYYGHRWGTRVGNAMVILGNNNNVGIGTTTPSEKLSIAGGNLKLDGFVLEKTTGSPNSGAIRFGDNTSWKFHFKRNGGTGAGKELMTIVSGSGNVGIGTASPLAKLHVNGSVRGASEGGALRIQTSHGYVDLGPRNGGFMHFITDKPAFYMNKRLEVDGIIKTYNDKFVVNTNGTVTAATPTASNHLTTKAYVDEKVGITKFVENTNYIGVRTPTRKSNQYYEFWDGNNVGWAGIHAGVGNFQGPIKATGKTVIDSDGGWHRSHGAAGWYNDTYGGGIYMHDSSWIRTYGGKGFYHNTGIMRTDGVFQVGPGGGNRFVVKSNGKVGIGTTAPSAKLHVNGKTRIMDIQLGWTNEINNLNGHLYLQHRGGYNTLFNEGGGNVGIGTTEPGAKLHVAGNVIASTPTANNHLTTKKYVDDKVVSHVTNVINNLEGDNLGNHIATKVIKANEGIDVDGNRVIDSNAGWHRSYGNTGWYNHTYGGGIYMHDSSWIRTYGNKGFYHNTGIMRTDGVFQVGSGGNRFVVTQAGNVGIGTTAPSAKFQVVGSGKLAKIGHIVLERGDEINRYDGGLYIQYRTPGKTILNKGGGNVGIGTTEPGAKLHVAGNVIASTPTANNHLTTKKYVDDLGATLLAAIGSGNGGDNLGNHTATEELILSSEGFSVSFGDIGGAFLNQNDGFLIGDDNAQLKAGFGELELLDGDDSVKLKLQASGNSYLNGGNVGIGTTNPEYKLDVLGKIRMDASIHRDSLASSDQRLKKNIKTIDSALSKVNKLRGVTFDWKKDNKPSVGFIAQEVEKILPQIVHTDAKGMKSVGYSNITAVLVEAVKELTAENQELKQRLEALEAKMK
ncbi:hypothetical protein CSB37_02755 [bacterium DOLZORAL124_38_8]|nr:MAG: hypothetical protein CSB37_02755 [bacterium DOLZORAL124_38_8]